MTKLTEIVKDTTVKGAKYWVGGVKILGKTALPLVPGSLVYKSHSTIKEYSKLRELKKESFALYKKASTYLYMVGIEVGTFVVGNIAYQNLIPKNPESVNLVEFGIDFLLYSLSRHFVYNLLGFIKRNNQQERLTLEQNINKEHSI